MKVQLGLLEERRDEAAALFYRTFQDKFQPMFGSLEQGIPILAAALDVEMAMIALDGERLVGIAGLQSPGRRFLRLEADLFVNQYGWLVGHFRFLLVRIMDTEPPEGQLFVDSLAVAESARGQGVGTRLLQAIFEYAHQAGFQTVGLDVVDTNPRARRLYERLGFVPVRVLRLPFLRPLMGFSSATVMVKTLE
jgi:ribosomal protein S18 acetylase RimI-like enzyme